MNIAAPLWTRGKSATDYMEKSGIFQMRMDLADRDVGPPGTNIIDKGMKCADVATSYGK